MTYYIGNDPDRPELICDTCGDARWTVSKKYGSNVDARKEEEEATGVRWSWVRRYSSHPSTYVCHICGGLTK